MCERADNFRRPNWRSRRRFRHRAYSTSGTGEQFPRYAARRAASPVDFCARCGRSLLWKKNALVPGKMKRWPITIPGTANRSIAVCKRLSARAAIGQSKRKKCVGSSFRPNGYSFTQITLALLPFEWKRKTLADRSENAARLRGSGRRPAATRIAPLEWGTRPQFSCTALLQLAARLRRNLYQRPSGERDSRDYAPEPRHEQFHLQIAA